MFRKYLSAIYVVLTILIVIYINNVNSIDEDIEANLTNNDEILCLYNEFIEINEPIRYSGTNRNFQITRGQSKKSIAYDEKYYDFKEKMLELEEYSNIEIRKSTQKSLENILSKVTIQTAEETENNKKDLSLFNSVVINGKKYSIKKIESEIEFRDKIKALKLATKLNIADLSLIIREGITKESLEKVKKQLKNSLTNKEYKEAKELAIKYMYLIEN